MPTVTTIVLTDTPMMELKRYLVNTWLFPRHIGRIYLRQAMAQAKGYAKGAMLDVGCGLRPYEEMFASRVTGYIGIDWPASPDKARQDVTGDATRLPFVHSAFDTVLATELMEHLPDPDQFLAEVARVLRGEGALILSVPFLEPLHEEPRDYYRFTPWSLSLLLEQHGFSMERIWARGGWWSVVLGSFVTQALYAQINPPDRQGQRRHSVVRMALVLPFCALCQFIGYSMDRFGTKSSEYTLGFSVLAVRRR